MSFDFSTMKVVARPGGLSGGLAAAATGTLGKRPAGGAPSQSAFSSVKRQFGAGSAGSAGGAAAAVSTAAASAGSSHLSDVTKECPQCHNPAVVYTSKSEKNPGRKYWNCRNQYCGQRFIEWVKEYKEKELPGLPEVIDADTMNAFLQVTQEQVVAIRSFAQRSPEWLQARVGRLTASNFGAAAGFNPYQSPQGLCQELLWGTFEGNPATRWGSALEDMARMEYIKYMYDRHFMTARRIGALRKNFDVPIFQCKVWECGLTVFEDAPFLAGSPDGLVHTNLFDGKEIRVLLEIKCPGPDPKLPYAEQPAYQESKYPDIPAGIPPYYYCQIQGLMAIYKLKYTDFVVKTVSALSPAAQQALDEGSPSAPELDELVTSRLHVTRYEFSPTFWENTLFPRLQSFYYKIYLPALALQKQGRLQPGEIEDSLDINL